VDVDYSFVTPHGELASKCIWIQWNGMVDCSGGWNCRLEWEGMVNFMTQPNKTTFNTKTL